MFLPALLQPVRKLTCALTAFSLLLSVAACSGGGGGDGTSPSAPAQLKVSGVVQAPNGLVAFHKEGFTDFLSTVIFASSAYASLSGVSLVPNGTAVHLGKMNSGGTVSVLASTTVSGGRYSFNLTNLGLTITSDLVVRVENDVVQMRAFVTQEAVNLDPISESTVQVVLDHIMASPETSLANFTPQELSDLVGAIDALTAANQSAAGADINSTILSIKTAAMNEPGIAAFLLLAGEAGQTNEGTGDIGNFVPLAQGSSWLFQGTDTTTGSPPTSYSNTLTIAGTKSVRGVETTVFSETNPLNEGTPKETYYTKDGRGLTVHGNNDSTDVVTPQLVPHLTLRFPFGTGSIFKEINKKGLDFGRDLDGDGTNEKANLLSIVTVKGFESVLVPAQTFSNCAKIETRVTITVIASSNGATESAQAVQTMWFAPGVGPVQLIVQIGSQTWTEKLTSFTQVNAKILNLATNDLIYDPGTQRIYASMPGTPGNITPIDPTTGMTGTAIPVGNDPLKLARSDNGQFLYVGLGGEAAVQRIDLTTQTAGLKFSLGTRSGAGIDIPLFAEDIEVLPGSPQSVAISRRNQGGSPRHEGVAIYDNGVQRPTTTPGHTGSNVIEFSASASRLYGYNQETTEFGFRRMTVDGSGVTVLDVFDSFMGDLITGFGVDIKFGGGRIYTTTGRLIDPEARTVVGTFSLPATFGNLVKPDAAGGRVFFLTREGFSETWKIRAFDPNTQQVLGSENVPGVTGDPGSLIRWGSKGLAFRTTGGQVFLIESPQLIP